jgi:hypothetical protein
MPSGLKHTARIMAVWPLSVAVLFPEATFHSRTVWSSLAEATILPSGLKATHVTCSAWPRKVAVFLPVATSHSRTIWSSLAEATVLPSGLKHARVTRPVCPLRQARGRSSPASSNGGGSSPRQPAITHLATRRVVPASTFIVNLLSGR